MLCSTCEGSGFTPIDIDGNESSGMVECEACEGTCINTEGLTYVGMNMYRELIGQFAERRQCDQLKASIMIDLKGK